MFIIVTYLYCYIIIVHTNRYNTSPKLSPENNRDIVSVVIACRNEEDNIIKLTYDIENQDFDKDRYQMIVVDDHSEDKTLLMLKEREKEWDQLMVVSQDQDKKGKRQAIRKGVELAKGDIIFCTDADCILGRNWIRSILDYFDDQNIFLVSSPVEYSTTEGFFEKFQYLEFLSLVAFGAGSIDRDNPILCNGANLAFRKKIYEEIPTSILSRFVTDDISLLHYIAKNHPGSICFAREQDAIVQTLPHKNYISFINQKVRWISRSQFESNNYMINIALVVLLMNLFITFFFALSIFNILFPLEISLSSFSKYLLVILFSAKYIIDYRFLSSYLIFFNKRSLTSYILPFEILYSIYISLIVTLSFIMRPHWKNRIRY